MSGPHPFTLRQLQYAVAVADLLSFRRAAERCAVSQPALSAQLAELEAALGARLFERDRRRVLVTPAGQALVERARQLLVDADDLQATARSLADPLRGTLRLGVIPTVSPYLLPWLTPALRARFPHLSLAWQEDKTASLVEAVDAGRLDAAVLALEADLRDLAHERLAEDPFLLAAPHGHPLARRRGPLSLSDLRGHQVLLLDEGPCLRQQALEYCTRGHARELAFRATSLSTLVQMVAAGAGVTLLPALAVPTEVRRAPLRLRRFKPPTPGRSIGLAWRRHSALLPALQAVTQAIVEAYPRPGSGLAM